MIKGTLVVGTIALMVAIMGCATVLANLNQRQETQHIVQVSDFGNPENCEAYGSVAKGIAKVWRDGEKISAEDAKTVDLKTLESMMPQIPTDLRQLIDDAYEWVWAHPELKGDELEVQYAARCRSLLAPVI